MGAIRESPNIFKYLLLNLPLIFLNVILIHYMLITQNRTTRNGTQMFALKAITQKIVYNIWGLLTLPSTQLLPFVKAMAFPGTI